MKQILAGAAAFLFLLAACGVQNAPDPSSGISAPQPVSGVDSGEKEDVAALLMQDYVQVYEAYCAGTPFGSNGPSSENLRNFIFGWTKENDLLKPCSVYNGPLVEGYRLPAEDIEPLCKTLFDAEAPCDADGAGLRFEAEYETPFSEPELTLSDLEKTEDGGWRLTIKRRMKGRAYFPAEYLFAPAAVPDSSGSFLKGRTHETIWRFVSVQNLPLPEKDTGGQIVKIGSAQELSALAELVNSGDIGYQNNIYLLENDIDMDGIPFAPIGSHIPADPRDPAPRGFCTTFDGQGHMIHGLTVSGSGMFAGIGKNGFVANLTLDALKVEADETAKNACGGIAGWVSGGWISKCTVSGEISGPGITGGVVGLVNGGVLQNCRADVTVTGGGIVGGLCGAVDGAGSMVTDCTVTGTVQEEGTFSAAGGFAGRLGKGTIDRGISSVVVIGPSADSYIGAFIGTIEKYSSGTIVGCFYDTVAANGLPVVGPADKQLESAALIGMTTEQLKHMGAI